MYRINSLLKQDQKLFHTADLAVLWNISNKNTLYTTIKRYIQKSILIPIHKGFYATVPLDQLHPVRIGQGFLHTYAYLSCEMILVQAGIIFQDIPYFTLMSDKSKTFSVGTYTFKVRTIKPAILYNNYGVEYQHGGWVASTARAVADMLYINPHVHFDNPQAIDWDNVTQVQRQVAYI